MHMPDMGFSRQLRVLRTRVQSTASLRAMKKFYHDGNITTAVADWKVRREPRSRRAPFPTT
jgi:hypothetical protein